MNIKLLNYLILHAYLHYLAWYYLLLIICWFAAQLILQILDALAEQLVLELQLSLSFSAAVRVRARVVRGRVGRVEVGRAAVAVRHLVAQALADAYNLAQVERDQRYQGAEHEHGHGHDEDYEGVRDSCGRKTC